MKNTRLVRMLCAVLTMFSLSAMAEYDISRKRIHYYTHDRGSAMQVTNREDQPVTFNAYVTPWDDATKEKGIEMVAYPPTFRLNPGESQTVRLLLRTNDRSIAPLFYRLNIGEKLDNSRPGQVQLAMSIPIYYLDQKTKPKGVAHRTRIDGKAGVTVENTGDTLLHLTHFAVGNDGFRKLDEFILPGRKYGFLVEGLAPPYRFRVAHGEMIEVR